MATYNQSLGKFQLTAIPPAPRGIPQIEVAFDIDANGILNVFARELEGGHEEKLQISPSSGLADHEIGRMAAGISDRRLSTDDPDGRMGKLKTSSNSLPDEYESSTSPSPIRPISVFISYSHRDESFRDELEEHLGNLRRQGLIDTWSDREIGPGHEWENSIDSHLRDADLVLLMISPSFLNSDYCYDREMRLALERHQAGEARVVPIIIRPTDWEGAPFAKLQALPTDGRPVTRFRSRDQAWLQVTTGLRKVVTEIKRAARGGP